MRTSALFTAVIFVLLLALPTAAQIPPASVINYQGVLRDASGAPLTGTYDISFRIYDAPTGGNEYLIDLHTTATGSPVSVMGGLFNVEIGSGSLLDGSGPGTFTSLPPVFQSTTNLYLEVIVGSEVLSPRIHFASAPSALNAGALEGNPAEAFSLKTANEVITGNWDNTTNPWADSEVSNALTLGAASTITLNTTPSTINGRLSYDATNDALMVGDGTVTDSFFSGGFNDTRFLRKDASDTGAGFYTFTGVPTGSGVGQGTLYLNPASAAANYTLFGLAVAGTQKFRLDAEGDGWFSGALTLGGALDLGAGANDDLTATDVTDLTDGGATILHTHAAGDATTLDGIDSLNFLRSDMADTAAGDITFSSGHIGVGATATGNIGIKQSLVLDTPAWVEGIDARAEGTAAGTTGTLVFGGYLWGSSSGTANDTPTYGSYCMGTGSADSTGAHYGVFGEAKGGTGAHYGVYGTASGGATNWGLYTPDNLQFGDSAADSHIFWGTLKSGSFSDSHVIIPYAGNWGYIGNPTNWWYRMFARTYYGKDTAIQAFDIYRDLDLLDAMQMVEHTDEKTGRTSLIFSPETLPPMIKGDPAVDGEGADQFVDLSKAIGFCFGSFRQMRAEVRSGLGGIQRQIEERTADPVTGSQSMAGNLSIQLDKDNNDRARFSVFKDGGTEVAQELMRLDEEGNLHLKGALRPSALDLAEYHPLSAPASAGDVLVADRTRTGFLRPCEMASDKAVVGIVSSEPGVVLGSGLQRIAAADPEMASALEASRTAKDSREEARLWGELERRFASGHAAIALSGTVPCKVDAGYGAIEVGDLLAASPTPGHAQRTDDPRPGTVVAKALEPLASGTGLIQVLVMLR